MELLEEILSLPKPSILIQIYEKEIFDLIPELEISKGFKQNNEWHVYDVYNHTLNVIDNVPNEIILRYAALFHDIGKPYVYTEDENGIGHFYNHWNVSKEIFDEFAKRNRLQNNLKNTISKLIEYHDINIDKLSQKELDNLLKIFKREELIMLFQLKKADLLAQNMKYHYLLNNYNEQQNRILTLKEQV